MEDHQITLPEHEAHSEARAAAITSEVHKHKEHQKMSNPINVFPSGDGGGASAMIPAAMMAGMGNHGLGGAGAGLGAGLVGGLLGGMLFGGRGFGGFGAAAVDGAVGCGARRNDCLTPEMAATQTMGLATAIGGVSDKVAAGDMMLMNTIGAGFANQGQMTLQQSIMLIQQANVNQQMLMSELCGINQNVSAQGCQTREAVGVSTATITALINSIDRENLNRQLTVADLDRRDERTHARQREVEVNVTQTVNQNQLQIQAQAQQQQILSTLGFLTSQIAAVHQEARATAANTNIIAGNTGAVTTAAQTSTASPTNVNA